jgi:hypothetical protein
MIKTFLDQLRPLQRMKRGFLDADADMPQPAGRGRVGEKALRQNRVEIEDRVTVETNVLRCF